MRVRRMLSQMRVFDRTRLGHVSRASFWLTFLACSVIGLLSGWIPVEIAYQLQLQPDGVFMVTSVWCFLAFNAAMGWCLARTARRRLYDAGYSGWWMWLLAVPLAGWVLLAVLLAQPSDAGTPYGLPPPGAGGGAGAQAP